MERDPLGFWRDYGAEPHASESVWLHDPSVIRVHDVNVLKALKEGVVLPPRPRTSYVLAIDPSVKGDAFGIALGHMEPNGDIVIDGTDALIPGRGGLNPLDVEAYIMRILDHYPVALVVSDLYFYVELQHKIKMRGVPVRIHRVKREDYERVKALFYAGKLSVPQDGRLIREMTTLIITPSGKITEPRGGSKDVSDAVANCVWALTQTRRRPYIGAVATIR